MLFNSKKLSGLLESYRAHGLMLLIGIFIGLTILTFQLVIPIMLVFGALSFLVLFFRPELGILAFLILAIKIVPIEILPDIRFAGGGIDIVDICIFAIFLVLIVHLVTKKGFERLFHPVSLPIFIYFLLACLSAALALLKGVPSLRVFGELRTVVYFLIFFPVIYFVDSDKKFYFLFSSLLTISALITLGAIINYFVDSPFLNLLGMDSVNLHTAGVEFVGVARVGVPGSLLAFIMFVSCLSLLVFSSQNKIISLAGSLVFGIPIILRFSRNLWISAFLSVIFVILIYCWINRQFIGSIKFWLFFSSFSFLVVLGIFLLETATIQSEFARAVGNRLVSCISAVEDEQDTLHGRFLENQLAIKNIRKYPLQGIGLGNAYHAPREVWGVRENPFTEDTLTRFIHNGWLYIPLKMGIPTLVVFIWLCVVFFRSTLANLAHTPISPRIAFGVGFTAAFLGFLLQSLVANRFSEPRQMAVIGLVLGLTAILAKNKKGSRPMMSPSWTRI